MSLRMKTYTDYDLAHLEELQRVICRAFRQKESRTSRALNLGGGMIFLIIGVAMILRQAWAATLFFVCVGLVLVARGVFFYKFLAMSVRQKMDKAVRGSEYILEKSYLLVINSKVSRQYPYTDCSRLFETENNIYYIMKNGQGLLLDKANLKGGSVDELRAWMEEKCQKSIEWMGESQKENQ